MATGTTLIDVADTAVKISFSGIIAAVSAYYIAKRGQRHEFDKEYFRRRQDMIEKVSAGLEPLHQLFLDICVDYQSVIDGLNAGLSVSNETRSKYSDYLHRIGGAFREMHVLEGKLLVVGATEATNSLRKYRLQCAYVNDMLNLEPPKHTKQQVLAALDNLHKARDDFYTELAKTFRNVTT